jgi:predicted dehydrogenase
MTVREGRKLVEAVQAKKCVFQTGTQHRSKTLIRTALTYVREGGPGKVKQAFALWQKMPVPTVGPSYTP